MRTRPLLGCVALVPLAVFSPARRTSGDEAPPVTREEFDKVLRELDELKRQGLSPAVTPPAPDAVAEPKDSGGEAGRLPPGKAGVFDKPFLQRVTPRAYVGGYFEAEFRDAAGQNHEFGVPRVVPFFYADVHERVKFASELELEDGGEEFEVEFAFLDLLLVKQANVRGGVLLDPLGKFNLIHDSPINDVTDRPLVDQFIIPTTFREVGAGLFGTLSPDDWLWEVKYEAYVTSGFNGLSRDPAEAPAINRDEGFREARAHEGALGTNRFGDINNAFAGVGRVSVSPTLGSEVGISGHTGAYDEAGNNNATIAAVDGLYTFRQFHIGKVPVGPIEILGEGAYAFIERDTFARTQGVPGDMWGYYGQVNYHFLPENFLPEGTKITTALFPDSVFTLVGRWDQVDLDGSRLYRATVGLNFRPVESAVVKVDYQFNRGTGTAPGSADDDVFLISVASYF
jgi:hypothetical protein